MRYIIGGALILLMCGNLSAQRLRFQFPSEMWHLGELTLKDGNQLEGTIKYDLQADVIQLRTDERIRTFAASQIEQFRIFQEDIGQYRTFYSISFMNDNGYKRPKLFELVFEGNTSLLAREFISITTRTARNPYFNGTNRFFDPYGGVRSNRVRFLDHNLYLVNSKGQISLLTTNRKDVIYSFEEKHSELKKFIKQQRLKMDKIEDVISLVQHYNQLVSL